MKKRTAAVALALVAALSGCASMNVKDRDLACALNEVVAESCDLGIQKSVEVCAISRKLRAKCVPEESKAELFKQLRAEMSKN